MFGTILKELRENNGYSMDKLVEIYNKRFNAKLNKSTLSRYENGLQEPMWTVVRQLSQLFNVSTDFMTGEETEKITVSLDNSTLILHSKIKKLDIEDKGKVNAYVDGLLTHDKYSAIIDDGDSPADNFEIAAKGGGIIQSSKKKIETTL